MRGNTRSGCVRAGCHDLDLMTTTAGRRGAQMRRALADNNGEVDGTREQWLVSVLMVKNGIMSGYHSGYKESGMFL